MGGLEIGLIVTAKPFGAWIFENVCCLRSSNSIYYRFRKEHWREDRKKEKRVGRGGAVLLLGIL